MTDRTELKRLAEACKNSLPLRYMESHGSLYIRNDHGIVFDVHQNRSFPEFMAANKAYADLVLAANPDAILALIAENEQLKHNVAAGGAREWDLRYQVRSAKESRARVVQSNKAAREGRDQLKAEVARSTEREILQLAEIESLRKDAEKLVSHGRNMALDEASTLCYRMAHEAYCPPGSRYKVFTPKAQKALGDILVAACNRIAELPDGPYQRHLERQQKIATMSKENPSA